MAGVELQMRREYLGLTIDAMANLLEVNPRTVRSWESGRDPIPVRVRAEIASIEEHTDAVVADMVAALTGDPVAADAVAALDGSDPVVVVWRSEATWRASGHPDTARFPARWSRHVVARAAHRVGDVTIRPGGVS